MRVKATRRTWSGSCAIAGGIGRVATTPGGVAMGAPPSNAPKPRPNAGFDIIARMSSGTRKVKSREGRDDFHVVRKPGPPRRTEPRPSGSGFEIPPLPDGRGSVHWDDVEVRGSVVPTEF